MKLNELVCPTCGLKCMTDASYTTCASCNTLFYACQSRSVDCPQPLNPGVTITTPGWPVAPLYPQPLPSIEVTPIWIAPFGPPGSPYGPTTICEVSTGGMTTIQSDGCQSWN